MTTTDEALYHAAEIVTALRQGNRAAVREDVLPLTPGKLDAIAATVGHPVKTWRTSTNTLYLELT